MKKHLKGILIAIGLIAVGFVIMQMFSGMKKNPEPTKVFESIKYVKTDIVKYSDNIAKITAFGKVRAYDKIEVFSEVGGIVLKNKPDFKEGNYFNEGHTMLKVDSEEYKLSLYSQKSDFLSLLTKILPDIKTDFQESFDNWNSYLEDFEIKDLIKEIPTPKSAKEKYFLASRNIFKMYYSIKNMEVRLSKYEIRAPFSGYVTMSTIERGTSIRVGQKLGEFSGTNNFELELPVNKNSIKYISVGNTVKVSAEDNSQTWTGRVVRIGDHINQSTQTLNVYVSLNTQDVFDGMYLKGTIQGKTIPESYSLPRKAVVNGTYVYTVKDSILDRAEVNVLFEGEEIALVSNIDSLTEVITEVLVNTALGTKVIPIHENSK